MGNAYKPRSKGRDVHMNARECKHGRNFTGEHKRKAADAKPCLYSRDTTQMNRQASCKKKKKKYRAILWHATNQNGLS